MATNQHVRGKTNNIDTKIRQFQENDLSSVRRLFNDGYLSYDKNVQEARSEYIKEVLTNHLHNINDYYINKNDGNFWVAEISEKDTNGNTLNEHSSDESVLCEKTRVIGCVGIHPVTKEQDDFLSIHYKKAKRKAPLVDERIQPNGARSSMFELQHLFVDPSFHGFGIAQRLLKMAEDFVFTQQGGERIVLNTGGDMVRACRFYEKVGYECFHIQNVNIRTVYPNGIDSNIDLRFYVKYNKSLK